MFVIPIYDMIILPEVTYYFKQDVSVTESSGRIKRRRGSCISYAEGRQKSGRDASGGFFPIGVSGK